MSFRKRLLAGSLAAALTVGMTTGCTTVRKSDLSDDYSEVVAATYGDEKIYLDEVNYYLRNSQIMYEYYGSIYGTSIWDMDGMEDQLRQEVMASIYQTRVLCDHADDYNVELTDADKELVKEAVDNLLGDEANADFMEIAGSDEEMLTDLMTKNALANKVYQAIISETDITVKEEDVRRNSISYLLFTESEEDEETADEETVSEEETASDEETEAEEETETAAETEEEKKFTQADANMALKKVQQGTSLEAVGEEYGLEVTETNFAVNEEQTAAFGEKAVTLKKGESAVAYEEGTGWYVMVCDSENDEEATAEAYESAVEDEKSEHFSEVYEKLDKDKFKVNEDVVKTLNIVDTPVLNLDSESDAPEEDNTDSAEIVAGDGTEETEEPETVEEETTAAE